MRPAWTRTEPTVGAQLRVSRGSYYHHGIYAAEDTVIHYAAEDGDGLNHPSEVRVRRDTLSRFLQGGFPEVRRYTLSECLQKRRPGKVAAAALGRIGEVGYDILRHNCEDFSNECAFGKAKRGQIDDYRAEVRRMLEDKQP